MCAFRRILITGGAGFVGANLCVFLKRAFAGVHVVAFDNLKRRGSELNLARLKSHGIEFIHGDVRSPEDLAELPAFDLLIDCAAEPSVHAGVADGPAYVINTNLLGTFHCLEESRRRNAHFLLLSSSRVYPIRTLNTLPYQERATRYEWAPQDTIAGATPDGITEEFPLSGERSFYGASKLAAELLLQEYAASYGMRALINRCGVLAGPWQMGRVDQGVVALWVASHMFQLPLSYRGFEGRGKQVRDVLHIEDLFDLLVRQMQAASAWDGSIFNVGGGRVRSTSLVELTDLCKSITGRDLRLDARPETSAVDLRIYLTNFTKVSRAFGWTPQRDMHRIVSDIADWLVTHRHLVEPIFCS